MTRSAPIHHRRRIGGPAATTAGVGEAVGLGLEVSAGVGPSDGEPAAVAVGVVVAVLPGRAVGRMWVDPSPWRSAPAWVWRSASASTSARPSVWVRLRGSWRRVGFGVGVGLGVGVGVGLGVGVAGGDTMNDAVGVSHQVPLVLNRNVYVHVPTGFVVEPV